MDFASSVSTALDPVLAAEGFAPGQCGTDQAIYCAGHDGFSDRFPRLPQSDGQRRGLGCCIDLVVDRAGDGIQVSLEGVSLAATLQALELDASVVDGLSDQPLDVGLRTLAEVLPRLFRAAGLRA